jgi:hypothetical protein
MHKQYAENIEEWRVGIGLGIDIQWQIYQGKGKQKQMPAPHFFCTEMRIQIPDEEHGLIEHEARKPDMGRTPEIRCQQSTYKGLHPEKEKGAGKNHTRKYFHSQSLALCARCCADFFH